jgi:O-antigen/teichoic acid export membrane protein
MDKATEMGKISTYNSVQVFLGTSASTVIRAVGAIILGLFILPADMGLYTVALIPQATLFLFQDWGIGAALGRYCAKYRATDEEAEQRKVIVAGLTFGAITGLVLTIVSFLLAGFFASTMVQRPESTFLIALVSLTMLPGGLASGVVCVFVGFEQMKLNSYMSVISAVVYSLLAPLLVYLGYGATGAIIGFTASSVVQGVISIVFLYFFIIRKLPSCKINNSEIFQTLKKMLKYGFPLGVGSLVQNLGSPVFSFLMATYVNDVVIGNYKIATNFIILITFITIPISNVLFPAFSKLDPQKEKNLIKTVFSKSVTYTNLFLVPASMGMIVLATPLVGTLYGDKWSYAPPLLALSVAFYLLSLVGSRSMGNILTAMGESKLMLSTSVLSLIVSIPVAFLLIPALGIIGLIVGLPLAAIPSAFVALYIIWKRYGAKADFHASVKILLASGIAALIVYLFLLFFTAPYWVLLITGSILFLAVYLISVPLVGAVNQSDIKNLKTMFSGIGIISRLLEIPLKIMQTILKKNHQKS